MKKTSLLMAVGSSMLLASCAGKSFTEAASSVMANMRNQHSISVKLDPKDSATKSFGKVSFTVEPVKEIYQTMMKSDNFIQWKFTVKNDCTRVYSTKGITFSVDTDDGPYDFQQMYQKGFYTLVDSLTNSKIDYMVVNPNHQQTEVKNFIWTYDYQYQPPGPYSPVKISIYNIPKCENGEISGHYNAEWNFRIVHL